MIGKKFGENAVIMEEFTRYFYDELEPEEEISYYEGMGEADIQSLFPAFSYAVPPCYPAQEDEGLFQIQGRIVHDGSAGFFLESGGAGEAEDGLFLTWETRQCTYPLGEKGEVCYIVCCTRDGIICKRAGAKEAIWRLSYRSGRDFGWVRTFFQKFSFRENLGFAVHRHFWQDFLSGNIDEKEFLDFFSWTENGISYGFSSPEYSLYEDRKSMKYQKYFPHNSSADARWEPETSVEELEYRHGGTDHKHWQEDYELWKRELKALFRESERGGEG